MMNEKEKLYDTLLQLGTALREKRDVYKRQ